MFYILLKKNNVVDIKIVETYNNKVIFELQSLIEEKKINIINGIDYTDIKKNYIDSYNIKFVFVNGKIWYKIGKDIDVIKRCIIGECSFLITGIYETSDKYKKIINLLLKLCKSEDVKKTLIAEIDKNKV